MMRRTILCLTVLAVFLLAGCSGVRKPPTLTYRMGDKVMMGSFSYSAFETQWLTHLGDGPAARLPQNRFCLVRINITNTGPSEALAPALTLVDDRGNVFEELNNGEGAPQWIGYLRQIRSAESIQGNVLFDAPPRHYKLRVTDESGERAGLIDIPLSFNAESPELFPPGDKTALPEPLKK